MDKEQLITLDRLVRNYFYYLSSKQNELIHENEKLKEEIRRLKSNINTLNQQMYNLELAFLGNQKVFDKLTDEHLQKHPEKNNIKNEIFLNLSDKSTLKKIRKEAEKTE